jgi:hypothetical protein
VSKIPKLLRDLADEFERLEAPAPVPAPVPAPLPPAPAPAPKPEPGPTPAPEPVPAPAPTPGPAPAPAPVAALEVHTQKFTKRFVLWPEAYAWQFPPYSRATQSLVFAPGSRASVVYKRGDWHGDHSACPARTYKLMLDGAVVASADVGPGQYWWQFDFTAPAQPGWQQMTVTTSEDEDCLVYFFCVTGNTPDLIPVVKSSLEMSKDHEHFGEPVHAWTWLPLSGVGPGMPTADHFYQPMVESIPESGRPWDMPVGHTADMPVTGDLHINAMPHRETNGAWSTMGQQPYYWDMVNGVRGNLPQVPLRDGPRGVGTTCFTTHIEIGRATQTTTDLTPRRNTYLCSAWSFRRMSNTGELTTLAGWRHKMSPDGPTDELELVGDWSAIPEAERGWKLLWGMCWDSRTLTVDTSQPLVDGRPPHRTGPRAYVVDSRRDALYRLQFPAASHGPAVVTKIAAIKGLWDCVEDPATNTMLVSLRDQHKVVRMTFDGEVLETVVQRNAALPGDAALGGDHVMYPQGTTLEQAQAQPCLAPEGLYLQDGLLYVGSKVQGQVKVFDLATRKLLRTVPVVITGNSRFVKFCVSDGSYAPAGTVFYATFDVQEGGRWKGVQPNGRMWVATQGVAYPMDSYQMSFGIGGGRMICGGSDHGLVRLFKGPAPDAALYEQGHNEFRQRHLRLVYGAQGVGRYRVADPSPALEHFLQFNGAL